MLVLHELFEHRLANMLETSIRIDLQLPKKVEKDEKTTEVRRVAPLTSTARPTHDLVLDQDTTPKPLSLTTLPYPNQ